MFTSINLLLTNLNVQYTYQADSEHGHCCSSEYQNARRREQFLNYTLRAN